MENNEKIIHQTEAKVLTVGGTTQFTLKLNEVSFSHTIAPRIGFAHNLIIEIYEWNSNQNLSLNFQGINPEGLKDLGNAFLSLAEKLEQREDKIEEAKEAMKKINI